ncbi:OmpA family protein [Flammeovirga yaeyamensis]|uniref:OmpA family protein n=1 Tax=Flammeovirga yaeyamensis TaxID=367791 RepID=A0AAX1N3Q9_9BACT|nr:OmpA family protein [Flammeovirga yaeyamensis]MBB3700295.1 outer membrane protein OmpA-like peptidoglycan-associated protein [Flammeovirga yaeyamensis]NMF37079.1 OmpA family protein [Flammeovirga yaeyamensis]QWG00770.1 OmpA family protein [Flammeovirga yaeyamensis]
MGNIFKKEGILLILLLTILFTSPVFAQKKKKKKNKKVQETEKNEGSGLSIQEFQPTKVNNVVKLPGLKFPNINKIPLYQNNALLAQIARLERNKQWEEYRELLYKYVTSFGINNFLRLEDMDLMWRLANVSEYLGDRALAKETYRLLLRHNRGDIKKALAHYEDLTLFDKPLYANIDDYYRLVEKRALIDTLTPPEDVLIEMGPEVNSDFSDYGMTLGGENQSQLLFTSNRSERDTSEFNKQFNPKKHNENIYISTKTDYDMWGMAEPLETINTNYNEGSPFLSKDGKTLYFIRCMTPEGYGDCDIYYSKKNEDGTWDEAVNLGSKINSYAWDSHPSLSMTEDTLYFASDRKGGFGSSDIYFSVKDSKGEWGKAKNIGPFINSRGSELSPYPHVKYPILYFSSSVGIVNFGGFDIYKSFIVDGEFSEPKNVGPLVNGSGDEYYFAIDAEAKQLYYAKSKVKGNPNLDMQSFPLPMEAKPNNTVRFSGRVVEPTTGEVFKGVVTIIDLSDRVEVAPKKIREDGSFDFELINDKKYLLVIEGDNFFQIEEIFFVDGDKHVQIPAVSVNSSLSFASIDFDPGSAKLKPEMENNLHLVIDFLVKHTNYRLIVTGHTDSDGNHDANVKLSKERAESIKEFIINYGELTNDRVIADGKGDYQPIVKNPTTPEEKRLNRRVEFKIFLDEYRISVPVDDNDDINWED